MNGHSDGVAGRAKFLSAIEANSHGEAHGSAGRMSSQYRL